MIAKTPWINRKFNFEFPISYFPCIVVRLEGTAVRIESYVKKLSESQLEQKEQGRWSIKEHIGHLTDLDALHEERLEDYRNKKETLRPADMTNLKTNEANHNLTSISKLLSDFQIARSRFLKQLMSMDERSLSLSAMHPRLNQPMRIVDMAFFVAEHDDQHITTIWEILHSIKK